jgi:hypothetical protein
LAIKRWRRFCRSSKPSYRFADGCLVSRAPISLLFVRALFDRCQFNVRNTRGVGEVDSLGNERIAVHESVIDGVKARCVDGVELPRGRSDELVKIKLGAFRGCGDFRALSLYR